MAKVTYEFGVGPTKLSFDVRVAASVVRGIGDALVEIGPAASVIEVVKVWCLCGQFFDLHGGYKVCFRLVINDESNQSVGRIEGLEFYIDCEGRGVVSAEIVKACFADGVCCALSDVVAKNNSVTERAGNLIKLIAGSGQWLSCGVNGCKGMLAPFGNNLQCTVCGRVDSVWHSHQHRTLCITKV